MVSLTSVTVRKDVMPTSADSDAVSASTGLEQTDEWLTTDQVADQFGFTRETVRRWTREGRVQARRDAGGRKLWIRRSDFAKAAGRADVDASRRLEQRGVESPPRIAGEPVTIAVPGDRTRLVAD